jgi:uncharacterized membrane protein
METDVMGTSASEQVSVIPPATGTSKLNVGQTERILSVIGGAALAVLGVTMFRKPAGKTMAVAGALLLKRGVTGFCEVNQMLGRNTATQDASAMEVKKSFVIDKPRNEVYAYWRKLENLPSFMDHLEEVKELDERRSKWTARLPGGVASVSWEAEIEEEGENSLIRWTSLPGSTIDNAGEVRFKDVSGNKTELKAVLSYRLPAGSIGSVAGKLFNPLVEQMVKNDLKQFKSKLESGEIQLSGGVMPSRNESRNPSGTPEAASAPSTANREDSLANRF